MSLQVIQSEEFPKSQLPYSPAIRVGPWLYVSGQACKRHLNTVALGRAKNVALGVGN